MRSEATEKTARHICFISGAASLFFLIVAIWSQTANLGWRCVGTSIVLALISVTAFLNSDL